MVTSQCLPVRTHYPPRNSRVLLLISGFFFFIRINDSFLWIKSDPGEVFVLFSYWDLYLPDCLLDVLTRLHIYLSHPRFIRAPHCPHFALRSPEGSWIINWADLFISRPSKSSSHLELDAPPAPPPPGAPLLIKLSRHEGADRRSVKEIKSFRGVFLHQLPHRL